jgi:hypothetical protein
MIKALDSHHRTQRVHAFERNRLRWTVEATALTPELAPLFTDAERAIARERLAAFGYPVP